MNKLKQGFFGGIAAIGACVALLVAGCSPVANLAVSGGIKAAQVTVDSAMAKPAVFVKAATYPRDAFASDSICVNARVRGGVHLNVRDALEKRLHDSVVDSLRSKGFRVLDSGCDVNLNLAFTMKQVKVDDEPKIISVKGVAEKDGHHVYALRKMAVFFEPLGESMTGAAAVMLDRMRSLYGAAHMDVSDIAGHAFWKSDVYGWDQLSNDTVCTSVSPVVTGDLGAYRPRYERGMKTLDVMLRVWVDKNLSDADTEDCDTNMVLSFKVDEPSGPPDDYSPSTHQVVAKVTAKGVPVYAASVMFDKSTDLWRATSHLVDYLAHSRDLAKELD